MIGGGVRRYAPFGVYEGSFASRNVVACMIANTVVGAVDIAVGRFGWSDPVTGEVSNAQIENGQLGIIMPRPGRWDLTYWQRGIYYLRAGKPVTLWVSGDFYLRFPQAAFIGNTVWVDPATGIAYGSNVTGGYVQTKFTVTTNASVGGLAVVSPYMVMS